MSDKGTMAIRVRPATRRKMEAIRRVKKWSLVEVADAAVNALVKSDRELGAKGNK
jgi:hypothetical protein